jgi:hypothetical protein
MRYLLLSFVFFLAAVPSCEDEYPPLDWECISFEGLSKEEAIENLSMNSEFHDRHSELWAKYGEPTETWNDFTLTYRYGSSGICLKMSSSCDFLMECN